MVAKTIMKTPTTQISDLFPRQEEGEFEHKAEAFIHPYAGQYANGHPVKKGFQAVEDAFIVDHLVEALRRHPHRFEHGKFAAAQGYIGADGVEDIGHSNEGDQVMKP